MRLPLYQIDAFCLEDEPFTGNPAAVMPLEEWLEDELLQAIAQSNNLSETAFFVPEDQGFRLRWFTPTKEVDLCGHATLATAWVLFHEMGFSGERILFFTRSGELAVEREGLVMDFPAILPKPVPTPSGPEGLGLGLEVKECLLGMDLVALIEDFTSIRKVEPDFSAIAQLEGRGLILAALDQARKQEVHFRFFAPKYGIDEDPVTGSAMTQLIPLFAERTGLNEFTLIQDSPRGGKAWGKLAGERVKIGGEARLFLKGDVLLEDRLLESRQTLGQTWWMC